MNKNTQTICFCHNVKKDIIEKAIKEKNIKILDEIFDTTTAGVGPCGGSCRPLLKKMLKSYLETGSFPKKIKDHRVKKR